MNNTFKNFNWEITNRELLLIIPNYGRGRYIRRTIHNLTTTCMPRDKWLVLIINDGINEDFSDLEDEFNLKWFTFERNLPIERNGAFIRNIAIKHCQCHLLSQKDPEILFTEDFIKGCFDHQNVLYRCGGIAHVIKEKETHEYLNTNLCVEQLIKTSIKFPITEQYVYWHYGHCVPIEFFKKLGGYDEDFISYGPEDHDMYDRLIKYGLEPFFDKRCNPIHLWHGIPNTRHEEMKGVYEQKRKEGIIRNVGINWGNG